MTESEQTKGPNTPNCHKIRRNTRPKNHFSIHPNLYNDRISHKVVLTYQMQGPDKHILHCIALYEGIQDLSGDHYMSALVSMLSNLIWGSNTINVHVYLR